MRDIQSKYNAYNLYIKKGTYFNILFHTTKYQVLNFISCDFSKAIDLFLLSVTEIQ